MQTNLADLVVHQAQRDPGADALVHGRDRWSYADLAEAIQATAKGFIELGLGRGERVAIYLEKRFETVVAMFAAAAAGCAFVPVNPLLKARQVAYILSDCNVRVLVTSAPRLATLDAALPACAELASVIIVGDAKAAGGATRCVGWDDVRQTGQASTTALHGVIDLDMAAILYTSGSTGMPKGVVLSHRNMLAGAASVSQYLANSADDRILSVLPLSFDAGLSQLTTAFASGATAVLLNYLLPRDVAKTCASHAITGLTCVPPLWFQLTQLDWPAEATRAMRYFANTGGHMPRPTLDRLRALFPQARPYLMYGLTEAFRSTYLDPAEVDRRPDSIGKAIPNAEIMVINSDGQPCRPGEHGELVHRGALVAMGYWNDRERTAERFRPAPGQPAGIPLPEMAVWSGDVVRTDADGFIYFVGRRDDMIKTSGYRVSPTEIEDLLHSSGLVGEAVALGIPHPALGHGIVVVATPANGDALASDTLMQRCRQELPLYMVPAAIELRPTLPRTPNGKIDRKGIAGTLNDMFRNAT